MPQSLKKYTHLVLLITGGLLAVVATAGATIPPGTTVLARTGADALVIWGREY